MSLLHRYKEFGEEFSPSQVELKQYIRINTKKIEPEELLSRLSQKGVRLQKVDGLESAYEVESPFSLSSCEEYLLGYFYIQEAASQLPVTALLSQESFTDDALFLDMCAAPGSKTTQLAQNIDGGTIYALDNHIQRLKVLHHNIERMGISNVVALRKEAQFADDLKKKFDAILLDAPCSGNFCIEPDYFIKRSLIDVKQKATVQKELLKTAHKILKKNGVLVYSTCSLEPEENELVIEWFLKKYPDMKLVDIDTEIGDSGIIEFQGKPLDASLAKTKRIWPHKTNMQGFFVAKLKKF